VVLLDLTIRERIIQVLRNTSKPLTVDEISSAIGVEVDARELYEHLVHIAKSIRARSGGREYLAMDPPFCRKCGYVFRDLDKPRKPSRCPRCRSEWISPPRFIILSVD
jgi:predicted Zn-ribbon and HTH transcriptional regulator